MNLIGVLSSDPNINKLIAVEFETKIADQYDLRFPGTREEILEFFNFELPEIVIINFTDPNIDMTEIVTHLKCDSWPDNFGIRGLFEQEKASEEEVLKDLGDVNVLAMLNHSRISSHIVKSVQIIDQNRQIIFQRELSDKLFDRALGSFIIDNDPLAVSIYSGIAATTLAQRGFILPEKKMHLQLALSELLIQTEYVKSAPFIPDKESRTVGMDFPFKEHPSGSCLRLFALLANQLNHTKPFF